MAREYVQYREDGVELDRFRFLSITLFLVGYAMWFSRYGALARKLLSMGVGDERGVGFGRTFMRRVE